MDDREHVVPAKDPWMPRLEWSDYVHTRRKARYHLGAGVFLLLCGLGVVVWALLLLGASGFQLLVFDGTLLLLGAAEFLNGLRWRRRLRQMKRPPEVPPL